MEEEIDIYGDLEAFGDDKAEILPEVAKVLQQENEVLQKKNGELSAELERITKYYKSLEANISSLLKTAKVEITRKDRMISDLRQQLDNSAFRRTTNYRIPKRTPKPSVISLPPKDQFTCTEIKKEPVNDTINKKETEYQSPLTTSEALDEPEYCYQPENIPVTLFGERLKRKLEQESREEAEAIEKAREEQAQPQHLDNREESSENTDSIKNKEDKESKYRLIPLTLQKLAENSRKRGSESLERSDNLEPPKKEDFSKSGDSYENKRRKFDNIEEKREKSPRVDRHNNCTGDSAQRKRPEIKTEYSCPGKADSSGSRSRSKSRERRDRRNPHSSLDRRKNPRERSKSPPRGHDSGKDKYRSSRKSSADRYGKRSRDNSPSLRRLNRNDINPPVSRIDLRSRLKSRYNDNGDGKIHADVGRRNRRNVNIRRSDMLRKSPRQVCRTSHNDKRRIDDSKYSRRSCINESRLNDAKKTKKEKSNSPHTERTGRDSSERKMKIQETEQLLSSSLPGNISVIDKMQVDLEDIEEGEIIDSPERESPSPSGWITGSRIIEPLEDDRLHSTINEAASRNLDDSLREEKIENIELFIEKLQSDDGELFRKQGRTEGQKLQSSWKNQQELGSGSEEMASHDRKINRQIEKDNSEESVHLTSILEDSSDGDEACEPASDRPTTAVNNNEREKAIDHNDVSSHSKLVLNDAKPSEIVGVLATSSSADKSAQVVSDNINNQKIFKDEAPRSPTPKPADNHQVKSPVGEGPEENESRTEKMSKSCSNLLDTLQTPRVILQEIDSPSKTSVKPNDAHPQKSAPKEKENSGGKTHKIIVVARRRRIRLTDSSTSMTVVVSEKFTAKN